MRIIQLFAIIAILSVAILLAVTTFIPGPLTGQQAADIRAADAPPVTALADREKLFGAESITLENGLQIILIANHRAPVITQMVWYRAGAVDELPGKTGLAHFLEHLMFKGSDNVASGAFSKQVRALGGNDNAFTTQDVTTYHQSIAVAHLETVMRMEADRMTSILLPEDEFEAERQVVLEERRQRTENDPRAHLFEQMRHALFPGHPYGAPVIGWEQDIKALTLDDARDWHQRWYTPNNAILVVSGDITMAELEPLAVQYYGAIPRRDVPATTLPPVTSFPGETRITLRDPRVHQDQLVRLYRVPGVMQHKQDSLALEVLQEILSGGASTRLYKSLVYEQKIATGANLGLQNQVRDTGTLSISLVPASGIALERLETAFEAEIALLVRDGVTETELAEAKTRMKDSAAFARDSLTGPARIIGGALSIGLTLDDVEYWTYDIDAVTAEQIRAVAGKYLLGDDTHRPQFVTGHILSPGTPDPSTPEPTEPAMEETP